MIQKCPATLQGEMSLRIVSGEHTVPEKTNHQVLSFLGSLWQSATTAIGDQEDNWFAARLIIAMAFLPLIRRSLFWPSTSRPVLTIVVCLLCTYILSLTK
jgi:hypothetical protein